jgi:hypothetical protein
MENTEDDTARITTILRALAVDPDTSEGFDASASPSPRNSTRGPSSSHRPPSQFNPRKPVTPAGEEGTALPTSKKRLKAIAITDHNDVLSDC